MNLYLLTQDIVRGYDTYDSMVVVAHNEEAARMISPCRYENDIHPSWPKTEDRDKIIVEYLGKAEMIDQDEIDDCETGLVIIASFNAG